MPQPLPPALAIIPDAVSSSPQALAATHTAYQVCLTAEAFNWNAITAGRDIALVRLVGWMMQKSPTAIARESITQEVLAAPMPHKVRQLGSYYSQYFVRIFRNPKGPTPHDSHPSRPSVDDDARDMAALLDRAPQNRATAKAQALVRDGYRCMITGMVDENHFDKPEVQSLPPSFPCCHTECCHIISPTMTGEHRLGEHENPSTQQQYAGSAWAALSRFGGLEAVDPDMFEKLNGANVHKLYNILTLHHDYHVRFDSLKMWLKATTTAHVYEVITPQFSAERRRGNGIPDTVSFSSSNLELLPLPDPLLLKLHATCAEVSHLSGAAEYIDKVIDDMNEGTTGVLAEDGSSYALQIAFARRNDIAVY